jgi:hypothetical protein
MIQTNLREIDMRDIDAQHFVRDLQSFDATVVLLNAAGIIANYPTDLADEPVNQYLQGSSLTEIIDACHKAGIRVIARTDFSKVRRAVYERHPDWAYRTKEGRIIDYNGDVHVCPNGGYQQEYMFTIISDMFNRLDFDGIFYNMSGFIPLDYSHNFYGPCHCKNCKTRFKNRFGLDLPTGEDPADPAYRKYRLFTGECTADLRQRLIEHVRSINPNVAIDGLDYYRMESNTEKFGNMLPLWQYSASSNTRIIRNSDTEIQPSNCTVDFISFFYRHVAVSPHLQELRLWQSIANLGNVDYYIIGRLDNHGDRSGFENVRKVFRFAKEHGAELEGLCPAAKTLVMRDEFWGGNPEASGWIRALSELHIPFDERLLSRLPQAAQLVQYKLVILPDIRGLSDEQAETLDQFVRQGGTVLATGETGFYDSEFVPREAPALQCLGMDKVLHHRKDMLSAMLYVAPEEKEKYFPHFKDMDHVAVNKEFIFTCPKGEAQGFLQLIPPQMFGPPERCYPLYKTDIPGLMRFGYGLGYGIYVPWWPGTFFFEEGYSNTLLFMRDVLERLCGMDSLAPALTPMVETTLAHGKGRTVVQLVNINGYYGNSYYEALPVYNITLDVPVEEEVLSVRALQSGQKIDWTKTKSNIQIKLPVLNAYEAVIIRTN